MVEILAERDGRALAPQLPPPGPPQPPAGAPPAGRNQADAAPAPAPPAARAGGMAPAARVGSGAPASRASSGAFSLALLDPTDSFLDEGGSLDGVAAAAAVRGGPEGGAAGAAAGEGAKGAASGGSGADLARRVEAFVRADTAAASEALLRAPRFEEYETALRGRFAAPLAAVQASLIRDTTLWQRGVLSTPAVVSGGRARVPRAPSVSAAPSLFHSHVDYSPNRRKWFPDHCAWPESYAKPRRCPTCSMPCSTFWARSRQCTPRCGLPT